jgi:predicted DNA-binding protein YlxM (UPF0122 family)
MGRKSLHNQEWEEIHQLLIDDDLSIQEIADKYKVMRSTIYQKAWTKGWLIKKSEEKKVGIINKIENFWKK